MSAPVSSPPDGQKVTITLPDGKTMTFARGVTGAEVAAAIGPGLAKAALAVEVDGQQWDIFRPIEADARLRIITRKDPEALEMIRHDAAHVLAMAVQELYPGTQVTIGPAIDNGFYYDFARDTPFTPTISPRSKRRCTRSSKPICRRGAKCGRATRRSRISKRWARHYKAELIREHSRRAKTSRSISTATGTTSAAGRISPRPARSATRSS